MRELTEKDQDAIRQENERIASGELPKYIVLAVDIGSAFMTAELAIKWHDYVFDQGVATHIVDLTDYDWQTNPRKLRMADTRSFAELDAHFKESAQHLLQ